MELGILGPLRVWVDGEDRTPSGRLQRLLLSLLLAHAGQSLSVDFLCEALWGDDVDDRATAKLQLLVHRLRAGLDDQGRVTYGPLGYGIQVEPGELDADTFELLAGRLDAVESELDDIVQTSREALAMWRGLPFQDVDDPSLESQRSWWIECRLVVLGRLFDAELRLGRHVDIVAEADEAARRHPLDERMQALLMTALYRSGRQGESLEVYRRMRERLVEELGVDPGPELRELHRRVLAGEVDGRAVGPVPAQLPQSVPHLTGRDLDLAALDKALAPTGAKEGHTRLCVVTGTAGVGKTALAVHWAHRHREEFPDGQLFFDLRGFGIDEPATPESVLTPFIRAMGGEVNALSQDMEEQTALFRSLVAGRRLLIVLDNARSAEQIRPLLPGTSGCLVVVTSRESLPGLAVRDGAQTVSLARLDPHQALSLLAHHAGDRVCDDIESGWQLVEHCACLPLALRIMAEQIRMRPGRDLAALLVELAGERARLDLLDMGDGPSTDVRAVFSWSYESLCDDARRLFRYLGLLPGPDADVETIAAMFDGDVHETRRLLDQLVRAHLVDNELGQRYCQHDLLRAYAGELSAVTDVDDVRVEVVSRLFDYYSYVSIVAGKLVTPEELYQGPETGPRDWVHPVIDGREAGLQWLDLERPNLMALVHVLGPRDDALLVETSRTLSYYLRARGHVADSLRLHSAAVAAALRLGDLEGESHAEAALGMHFARLGNLDPAELHLNRALELYRQTGNAGAEAAVVNNLGTVAVMRGDQDKALRMFQHAWELYPDPNESRALITYVNVAHQLNISGAFDEAREHLDRALKVSRERQFGYPLGYGLCILAENLEMTGDFEAALEWGREAIEVGQESGDRLIVGEALEMVAKVHLRRGEVQAALSGYESALVIGREIGFAELTAGALEGLALVQADHDPTEAVRHFEEAVEIAARHGLAGRERRNREALAGLLAQIG